jgi:hypothetical protein
MECAVTCEDSDVANINALKHEILPCHAMDLRYAPLNGELGDQSAAKGPGDGGLMPDYYGRIYPFVWRRMLTFKKGRRSADEVTIRRTSDSLLKLPIVLARGRVVFISVIYYYA